MSVKNQYKYCYGLKTPIFDFTDKNKSVDIYVSYMLARTQSMFSYEGLPDTIPERMIELYLQTNGNVCIAEHNGDLYAFTGGLGGVPNAYYMPTIYTVANPALNFSKSFEIDKNCVVIPSDDMYIGLLPMFSRYATQLVENDITMVMADINLRIQSIVSASDDRTRQSSIQYLADLQNGKLGVVAESEFLSGIKTSPMASTGNNYLSQLIEFQQYLKAGWYNDLGLQSNYNMKRESLNSNETQMNEDALLPLIDNMLKCREQGLEKVNAMFGTSISVDKASAWKYKELDISAQTENEEALNNDKPNVEGDVENEND